jgi:hypothetical protein
MLMRAPLLQPISLATLASSDIELDPSLADHGDNLELAPEGTHTPTQRGDEMVIPSLRIRQLTLGHLGRSRHLHLGHAELAPQIGEAHSASAAA